MTRMPKKSSKHETLPIVSENRIFAAINLLCKKSEGLPLMAFKGIDTKGHDVKRLFKIMKIIEEIKKTNGKIIKLTERGKKYLCFRENKEDLLKHLSTLFQITIDEFDVLLDILLSLKDDEIKRDKLFNLVQENLWKRGRKVDIPSFNAAIALAKMTKNIEIKKRGVIKLINKDLLSNYLDIKVQRALAHFKSSKEFHQDIQTKTLIKKILSFIPKDLTVSDIEIYNNLVENREKLGISFSMGAGENFIEPEKAVVILGDNNG